METKEKKLQNPTRQKMKKRKNMKREVIQYL